MRKYAASLVLLLLLLVAAFFLPEALSSWNDRMLLDNVSLQVQMQDQEGFAESIQLSIAEKVMLLRSGGLTAMELSREVVAGVSLNVSTDGGSGMKTNIYFETEYPGENNGEDSGPYSEETTRMWEARLTAARREVRNLQALGGLPTLWSDSDELDCTGYGELLYMDPDTQMSFQVYRITMSGGPYSLELLMDAQSERIMSFSLQWAWEKPPNWGIQGAASFGGTWRSYWELDSVSSGWYDEYTRNILERVGMVRPAGGDYSALGQVIFSYDGQSLAVPLLCQAIEGRSCLLNWNW